MNTETKTRETKPKEEHDHNDSFESYDRFTPNIPIKDSADELDDYLDEKRKDAVASLTVLVENMDYKAVSYSSADAVGIALTTADFVKDEYRDEVERALNTIVSLEAPISLERIAVKVARAFRIQRTSSNFIDTVKKMMQHLDYIPDRQNSTWFYWRKDQNPGAYSEYRVDGQNDDKRSMSDITKQELKNALCVTIKTQGALVKDTLMKETVRTMGYSRSGAGIIDALDRGLEYGRSTGEIKLNEEGLFVLGKGDILGYVIDGFNAKDDSGFNNIVQFQSLSRFKSTGMEDVRTAEDILYRLMNDENKERAFNDACLFWGCRFPELSYLMFAYDSSRYVPVKTDNHKAKFARLGIDYECLSKCSWENYNSYIIINEEIRQRLEAYLGIEVSLLDAHSFIWMVDSASKDFEIADKKLAEVAESDDPFESVVIVPEKEGKKVLRYVSKYERSSKNRSAAIKLHGCKCMACGFDFEKIYGELGKGFIEVHHVVPISSVEEEVIVNPETDLVCLCANCHRMIHKKRGSIMTVEELKRVLKA